jgi:hypothetical protein
MTDPVTISPGPSLNPGLDYAALKKEGTTLVQEWSGAIWTDYNESDPGVTILEQLCYALTELSYRAEFPLKDQLIDPRTGRIDAAAQALYPPEAIFPVNPLTPDDYRKLILDRVPGLANAWFEPMSEAEADGLNGLYRIWLYRAESHTTPVDEAGGEGEAAETGRHHHHRHHHHHHHHGKIFEHVWRAYNAHRAVCEDAGVVGFLEPVDTVVHADVAVAADASAADVLAGILFNVGLLLAPEPKRHSLQQALAGGLTPSEILTGPLLLDGLVDDDELKPRASAIPVQDIVRAITGTKGVRSAGNVAVALRPDGVRYSAGDSVPVPPGGILKLDTQPAQRSGEYAIRIIRNGVACHPDADEVNAALDALWSEQRHRYDVAAEYAETLALPQGQFRDLRPYFSIQNQFPNVYGINSFGLPLEASAQRKALARQLKGYLLAFEQLMADFFAQISRVRDLYSVNFERLHTYFFQYLTDSVPDVGPLLKRGHRDGDGYLKGLTVLVHSQDRTTARRNRFLDVLLALYAEAPGESGLDGMALIRAKRALLVNMVDSTARRGAGFDYLARARPANIAGMLIKSRIELGMPPFGGYGDEDDPQAGEEPHSENEGAESVGGSRHRGPGHGALYVVEHILLRYGARRADREDDEEMPGDDHRHHHHHHRHHNHHHHDYDFPYSMTITAVLFAGRRGQDTQSFVARAMETVRTNTPAHVMLEFSVVGHADLHRFERLYRRWRRALRAYAAHVHPGGGWDHRHHRSRWLRATSRQLREFLEHHRLVV